MRLRVLQTFRTDKPEHVYLAGAEITASDEFGKSIIAKGLAVEITEDPEAKIAARKK